MHILSHGRCSCLQHGLGEIRGLYRGVVGAASAAGVIIGVYFAFYSSTKRFLRRRTSLHEGRHLPAVHAHRLSLPASCFFKL